MRIETKIENKSSWEIERWTEILDRTNDDQRLRRYLCSLTLGRDFKETSDAYFVRK